MNFNMKVWTAVIQKILLYTVYNLNLHSFTRSLWKICHQSLGSIVVLHSFRILVIRSGSETIQGDYFTRSMNYWGWSKMKAISLVNQYQLILIYREAKFHMVLDEPPITTSAKAKNNSKSALSLREGIGSRIPCALSVSSMWVGQSMRWHQLS